MELPHEVQVGPYRMRVRLDRHLSEHTATEGRCWVSRQEILLHPDNGPDRQAVVLLHEVLHALWIATGLQYHISLDESEPVIEALAPALVDTLRRNPDLVLALMGLSPQATIEYVDTAGQPTGKTEPVTLEPAKALELAANLVRRRVAKERGWEEA